MILKILGGVFIMISSCVLGVYYSFKAEYRINDLFEMKKALTMLISEIEFNLSPLAEAMGNISFKAGIPVSKIFSEFSKKLGSDGNSAFEVWKSVLKKEAVYTYFASEDIEAFISFGQSLGFLDRQQQHNNIKMAISYIENKIPELSEKSKSNKKMCRSLGVFGGAAVMVILF